MTTLTIEATIAADAAAVWHAWTSPDHIVEWNHASDDWHSPAAANDLRVGGRFCFTMAAKDGSVQFDFTGTYTRVEPMNRLAYTIDDGRTVDITFTQVGEKVHVVERFEAENVHPPEMQQAGWQAILDNFKRHVER